MVTATKTPVASSSEEEESPLLASPNALQTNGDCHHVESSPAHPSSSRSSSSCGSAFAFTPELLENLAGSKNLDQLEALGGIPGLARGLQTDAVAGLGAGEGAPSSPEEPEDHVYAARRRVFGSNRVPGKRIKGVLELMLLALNDKVLILLSVLAVISLAIGLYQSFGQPHEPGQPRIEWLDGVTIVAAVMIVVVTGAVNDYQKERQFARLNKKKEHRAVRAIRCGKIVEISVFDVLVGDVLQLASGDLVPADGVLISGHAVRSDESTVTGESNQIKKVTAAAALDDLRRGTGAPSRLDPFVISGSKILEGVGAYLVTAVGVHSMHGKIRASLAEPPSATPLQERLSTVADQIAIAGVAAATTLFAALAIKLLAALPHTDLSALELLQALLRIFITAIAIVVIAVPEGLPLAVTLALAIAVTRMLRDNNLVRVLASCETMGNATTICSDKTGTLTMNRMTVTEGFLGVDGGRYAEGVSVAGEETNKLSVDRNQTGMEEDSSVAEQTVSPMAKVAATLSVDVRDTVLKSIAINSTAFEGTDDDGNVAFIGSNTEAGLLEFARKCLGMQALQIERANVEVVYIYPFDSSRKSMATVTRLPSGTYRTYVKGAPEVLLEHCVRAISRGSSPLSQTVSITEEQRSVVRKRVAEYGSRSLRVLMFAYKDTEHWPPPGYSPDQVPFEDAVDGLSLLGCLGIRDPLRPGVADAVAKCQSAGIMVRMVTGDNVQTARAIATQCGILDDQGIILDGQTFRKLSEEEMDREIPQLQVLARSTPEDKRTLVKHLQRLGETVAVTGDGTNDAPALKAADVGFSMGLSGTETAKEASAIVLMDDDFSSIVKAVEWGRAVNDAVKKFLNFQLTANVTSVTITFVSAISSQQGESILTPVQLLWVNLIMDTFAALALSTDPPNPAVLRRQPEKRSAPIISTTSWKLILGQAVYQLVVILLLDSDGAQLLGLEGTPQGTLTLDTIIFNVYVCMQFFNLYNNRRLDNGFNVFQGLAKNPYFICVNAVIAVTQFLIIHFGGSALGVTRLSAKEWAVCVAVGALCIPFGMVLRCIPDEPISRALTATRRVIAGRRSSSIRGGEARPTSWSSALRRLRCELVAMRQPRSSRLQRLRKEISQLALAGLFGEGEDERQHQPQTDQQQTNQQQTNQQQTDQYKQRALERPDRGVSVEPSERTPLLLEPGSSPGSDDRSRRSSSVFAASVIMAGLVAGGVAGWPDTDSGKTGNSSRQSD